MRSRVGPNDPCPLNVRVGEQLTYDPLDWQDYADRPWYDIATAERQALMHRNKHLKELRQQGAQAKGTSLRGQLRPYASLGVPDGRVRTVYYIIING